MRISDWSSDVCSSDLHVGEVSPMSATTIKQTEALPASYPDVTPYPHRPVENGGVTDAEIDPALVWQRIESYIAYRWSEREVVWIVEGSGDWTPPPTPATLTETEVWTADGWAAVTLAASPYGGYLLAG